MRELDVSFLASKLSARRRGVSSPRKIGRSKKSICDHCGKKDLNETIEFEMPDGSKKCFGSECAEHYKFNSAEFDVPYIEELDKRMNALARLYGAGTKKFAIEYSKKVNNKDFYLKTGKIILGIVGVVAAKAGRQSIVDTLNRQIRIMVELPYSKIPSELIKGLKKSEVDEIFLWIVLRLSSKPGVIIITNLGEWAYYGFPTIKTGHKFASAMCTTRINQETIQEARPPFDSFIIDVPDNLLPIEDSLSDGTSYINRIFVSYMDSKWTWLAMANTGTELWRVNVPGNLMAGTLKDVPETSAELWEVSPLFDMKITDSDERLAQTIGKFIINMSVMMSSPEATTKVGKSHERWESIKANPNRLIDEEPKVREFYVGKDITRDFRKNVSDYIRGTGKKLDYQIIVSGHYRPQHYGTGNLLVKIIWISPYWKGDPEAKIPIRTIRIK